MDLRVQAGVKLPHEAIESERRTVTPLCRGPWDIAVSAYSSEEALATRLDPPGTVGHLRTGQRPVLSRWSRGGLASNIFSGLHAVGPPHAVSLSFLLDSFRVWRRLPASLTVDKL